MTRTELIAAMKRERWTDRTLAAESGISRKHLTDVLTGRRDLSFAETILVESVLNKGGNVK